MLASPQPTAVEQLTLSSVKLYFSLSVGDCFYALWNETCSIISVLCVSTKCLLLKNKRPCFFFVVMLFLILVFCKFLVPRRCFISITRNDDFLTYQP